MSSSLCLTTCLYWLLSSLFINCDLAWILLRTISSCGNSRNSAAWRISYWKQKIYSFIHRWDNKINILKQFFILNSMWQYMMTMNESAIPIRMMTFDLKNMSSNNPILELNDRTTSISIFSFCFFCSFSFFSFCFTLFFFLPIVKWDIR